MTTIERPPTVRPETTGRLKTWPLQACLLLNIVAAGAPGAVLLAAPGLVPDVAGGAADPEVARLIGAVWLAIGGVSLLGLRRPLDLRGVLAVLALWTAALLRTREVRR